MLEKAARELRSMRYEIGRCVQEGLTNFVQLSATTAEEIEAFRQLISKRR